MTDCLERFPDFPENGGLLPAIAQDSETGEVLMLAWMNADSLQRPWPRDERPTSAARATAVDEGGDQWKLARCHLHPR